MKFDAGRACALSTRFGSLRRAGSPGAREAAEQVAAELREAGLAVEVIEGLDYEGPAEAPIDEVWPPASAVTAVMLGLWLEFLAWSSGVRPSPLLVGLTFGLLMVLHLAYRRFQTGLWGARRIKSWTVHATPPPAQGAEAPVRVIFMTHLDSRPPPASLRLEWWLGLLGWLWLAFLIVPIFIRGGWDWLERAGPALLVALGGLSWLRWLDPWMFEQRPHAADNRAGLGFLIELARSWPAGRAGRIEAHFVALGRQAARDPFFTRTIDDWPRKPTLVLNFESPGLGSWVRLSGSGRALTLGEAAARDLWLPASPRSWRPGQPARDHVVAALRFGEALSLTGDLDAERIDPALLGACAQWAQEVALRWSRPEGRGEPAPAEPAIGLSPS